MSESTDRTKGPWTIRRSITGYVDEIVGADGQAICYGGIDEGPAKLIAAAPEMRDELHRLRAGNAKLRQQVFNLRAVVIPAGLAQDRMREDAERYTHLKTLARLRGLHRDSLAD